MADDDVGHSGDLTADLTVIFGIQREDGKNLFYLPPLFLPFGLRFRHGSCSEGACMVPRNAVPSKPDTSERRERAICLESGFLRVIFCSHYRFKDGFAATCTLMRPGVWAMDYAEGKSTGQALTCPVAAG